MNYCLEETYLNLNVEKLTSKSDPPPVPGQGHVQEVVLRVAVEGATEAHGILHPSLVHLQVEPKAFAVVEHPHTHVGPHPQEHGGQPPDLKGIWAQNRKGDVGGSANMRPPTPPPACPTPAPRNLHT